MEGCVLFKQSLDQSEELRLVVTWGESIPDRGNSQWKAGESGARNAAEGQTTWGFRESPLGFINEMDSYWKVLSKRVTWLLSHESKEWQKWRLRLTMITIHLKYNGSLGQGGHHRSAKKCSDLGHLLRAERLGLADRTERKTGHGGNGNRRFQPSFKMFTLINWINGTIYWEQVPWEQ